MYDLRKFPVLRVLLPFFGGVVSGTAGFPAKGPGTVLLVALFLLVLTLCFFFWPGRSRGRRSWIISLLLFLLLFFSGAGHAILTAPFDPELPVDEQVLLRGEVCESPFPGPRGYSFKLQLHQYVLAGTAYSANTELKTYLRLPTDPELRTEAGFFHDSLLPLAGEIWQFSGRLVAIQNRGNPGGMDFKSVMNRNNCWYRFYISTGTEAKVCNRRVECPARSLSPALIRQQMSKHWQGEVEEVSLLKAVCLGDRSLLTDDLRQAYAAAGGMHLLAVSGLHVGLIWWVLQYMTGWMHLLFRSEKLGTATVIGLLWFYAFLTGFSSSVSRSVSMFSFFSAGRIIGTRIHPLNGIFVSAFLLVLVKPDRLLDLGFQLSYSAIIGIVSLYPLLKGLLRVQNRVLRWIWEAISVSLAAQLSTAPLVIYYFHQFPLYSLLTSLITIPVLSILICIFVCSVPFISLGILEEFFNFLLTRLARLMNWFMRLISDLPGGLLNELQLDRMILVLLLLLLLMLLISLHVRSRVPRYLMLLLVSVSLVWSSCQSLIRQGSSELLITHFRGASMVLIRDGSKLDYYCWSRDSTSTEYMESYMELAWSRRIYEKHRNVAAGRRAVRGSISTCIRLREGLCILGHDQCAGLVIFKGVHEYKWEDLLGASSGKHSFNPDFILLSGEPELHGLPDVPLREQMALVLDGSNRSWYKESMGRACDGVYLTDRSGAYVKRW